MIYALMGKAGPVEPEEYKALINQWLGPFLRYFFDMRILKGNA